MVLFDSGNRHTFIAKVFLDITSIRLDDLGHDLIAFTPAGVGFMTGVCVRDINVEIQ